MLKKSGSDVNYLDISNLDVGLEARKKAYLLDVSFKYDKNGDPYFVYVFKDCNKAKITGRQFKVPNATEESANIVALKGKLVEVAFTTRVWGNSLNLVVDAVYPAEGDISVFLTEVSNLESYTKALETSMSKSLGWDYKVPFFFSISCLPEVCNGELGGYVKLLVGAYNHLISLNGIPGVDITKLLTIFERVQRPYLDYLELRASSEVVASVNVLDIIINSRRTEDTGYEEVVSDCLASLCGLAKPSHVYACLVSDAINHQLFALKVAYDLPLMAKGFSQIEGDYVLTNY